MEITKKTFLFLFGCIGSRSLLVYFAKYKQKYLKYMGVLALIPAIGFMYYYFSGKRTKGPETFGELIWWNNIRPIHAINYTIFAYLAIKHPEHAYIPLLIDVCIGLLAWLFNEVKH